jgi:hypothetical protein
MVGSWEFFPGGVPRKSPGMAVDASDAFESEERVLVTERADESPACPFPFTRALSFPCPRIAAALSPLRLRCCFRRFSRRRSTKTDIRIISARAHAPATTEPTSAHVFQVTPLADAVVVLVVRRTGVLGNGTSVRCLSSVANGDDGTAPTPAAPTPAARSRAFTKAIASQGDRKAGGEIVECSVCVCQVVQSDSVKIRKKRSSITLC